MADDVPVKRKINWKKLLKILLAIGAALAAELGEVGVAASADESAK